jgi:hypothetical protein
MKKILQSFFCVVLAILMFSSQAVAYTSIAAINSEAELSAVADFDEAEIYAAFNEVEALITTIESTNLTYADLEASNSDLISDVSASAAIAMSSASADTPPFISAFLWGCIFNLAGMLIVGITTEFDSDQLRKSAWGCLISSLLWGGTRVYYY